MKIIQISDLHLTDSNAMLFGRHPQAQLKAAVDSVLRDHQDAAFCLLSGDLADAGTDSAYAALAAITARLPMPVYPLVGNHDDRSALLRAFPSLQHDEWGFIQSAVDTPHGRFLLLDTLDPGKPWGEYCETRQAWLRQQLTDVSVSCFWIVMHHPPLAVGIPSMDQYALKDQQAFYALLAPFQSRIRHLFFGHLHRPIGGSWHGIPFSVVRSPNHQVALDMKTRSEVPGCHEAPGYAVVLIDETTVIVHHHDFQTHGERFWL
ncbi:MAG TPA: phosphodiesterase [Burkholderiales bacterium]|nr:phosphodiesterase [Burkholderiales bacterium]